MKNKNMFKSLLVIPVLLMLAAPSSSLSSTTDTIVLSASNTLTLNEQVDGESVSKIIAEAKTLDGKLSGVSETVAGKKPLYLFLNTPGGSIQAGLEMIEALKGLDRKVNTITLFAASMGFQIAQNLDDRLIIKSGVLMSHRARGGFEGEFGGQAPSQIDSRYALWIERLNELDMVTVTRTAGKQTLESYQKQYASEMWLTGQQSVAQGYADRVVNVKCDASLVGTTKHKAEIFIFKVSYELDKCPLNTSPLNVKIGFGTNKGEYMDADAFLEKGGRFGHECLTDTVNKDRLCALDTSLNMEKVRELQVQFRSQFESKKNKVVSMF